MDLKDVTLFVTDREGLLPAKMEELAQQAANEVYSKENTGAHESLRYNLIS